MSGLIKLLIVSAITLGLGLLFGLVYATRSNLFDEQYRILSVLNFIAMSIMAGVLLVLSYWVYQQKRKKVFGARLIIRFALSFMLLALIPSVLLFGVSKLFLSRSMDSWFNLPLDAALNNGLDFGKQVLTDKIDMSRAVLQAPEFEDMLNSNADRQSILDRYQWDVIAYFNINGRMVWHENSKNAADKRDVPSFSDQDFRKSITNWYLIEDDTDSYDGFNQAKKEFPMSRTATHVLVNAPHGRGYYYVQFVSSPDFTKNIANIQRGLSDYQATITARKSLNKIFQGTLMISVLITLLVALATAFLIADRLIQPLIWLASATKRVASGQYNLPTQKIHAADEMMVLIESFNQMGKQLGESQQVLKRHQKAVEAEKAFSEAVLNNLSSSVLVFDQQHQLESCNEQANHMFSPDLKTYLGVNLINILPLAHINKDINKALKQCDSVEDETGQSWRVQTKLSNNQGEDDIISIQGSRFIANDGSFNYVLVCDDITPIVSAQRTMVWSEVAQRLAHEIKNPLTPIQLSAERLQLKLSSQLDDSSKQLLQRSTQTIINQVDALQNLVDDFRDFARKSDQSFQPIDLNRLISDILALYEAGQHHQYEIRTKLGLHLPYIIGDESQLRQVLHNLIKNALEAKRVDQLPIVEILTSKIPLQTDGLIESYAVMFQIRDFGQGFTPKVLARMFEPYNTSKSKGTGLGLPVVKKILDTHHAQISIKNIYNRENQTEILGAQVGIVFINTNAELGDGVFPPSASSLKLL